MQRRWACWAPCDHMRPAPRAAGKAAVHRCRCWYTQRLCPGLPAGINPHSPAPCQSSCCPCCSLPPPKSTLIHTPQAPFCCFFPAHPLYALVRSGCPPQQRPWTLALYCFDVCPLAGPRFLPAIFLSKSLSKFFRRHPPHPTFSSPTLDRCLMRPHPTLCCRSSRAAAPSPLALPSYLWRVAPC